jgi:hypothetical protein
MAQTIQYQTIRDIALDDNGDWDVSNGDLQLIGDIPAIVQAITIALEFFQGEWFLDQSAGIPFWTEVLIKNPDVNQISGIFRNEILGVPGVLQLDPLVLEWNTTLRQLSVTFSGTASTGLFQGSTVLNPPSASGTSTATQVS